MIKRLRRSWLGETRTGGRLVTVNLEKEVAGEQEPLEVVVPVSPYPPPPRESRENRTVSDLENEYIFIEETEDERRLSTSSPPKKC